MPQEIYNEGRVVGLSAWEIYMRDALSNGVPQEEIPSENKWLASMIGAGASIILKIPVGTSAGIKDFVLPQGSNLSAAGVIIANPFIGTCSWDETGRWATKVISYGPLIQNNATSSPDSSVVPPVLPATATYSAEYTNALAEFLKITDGLVYTSGATWISREDDAEESFPGDSSTTSFTLHTPATAVIKVVISDVEVTDYTFDESTNTVVFTEAPEEGTFIKVFYKYDATEANGDPEKDIDPNFNNSSTVVRLNISATVSNDIMLMLTGFTNKRILQGLSGFATTNERGYSFGGSTDITQNEWRDGGLLGPEIIPWASKIVFCVPSSAYSLINSLKRTFPYDSEHPYPDTDNPSYLIDGINITKVKDSQVRANSVVDFNSIVLTDYYDQHSTSSPISVDVSTVTLGGNESTNALVAWYPGVTANQIQTEAAKAEPSNAMFFPPAIYAAKVTATGTQTLVPLDTAAPGTVKGFENSTSAYNYVVQMPDNYAVYHNSTTNTFSFADRTDNVSSHWSGTAKLEFIGQRPTQAWLTAGSAVTKIVTLTDETGSPYGNADGVLDGSSGVSTVGPQNNLTWVTLLDSIKNNTAIDVLGNKLHYVGTELHQSNTIGIQPIDVDGDGVAETDNTLSGLGTTGVTLKGTSGNNPISVSMLATKNNKDGSNLVTVESGASVKSGTQFIEFSNGLRLYIAKSAPTGSIPDGSIGIGW